MQGSKVIIMIIVLFQFFACKESKVDAVEYMDYVIENHSYVRELGEYRFELLYKPTDYVALMEYNQENTNKPFEEIKNSYQGAKYFTFAISRKDGKGLLEEAENEQSRTKLLHYLSYKLKNDLTLKDNKETTSCSLYSFERVYGVSPRSTFVVGFNGSSMGDMVFEYDDKILGVGKVRFAISQKEIENIPQLIIS